MRICAVLLVLVSSCESATAPSVQDGFDAPGSKSFGQPTLVVSTSVAVGHTLDPIVETAASLQQPDDIARQLSRFKSSNAGVIVVNADGTLTARATGSAVITANLDGVYDSRHVTVIAGWRPTIVPINEFLEPIAVNDSGDVLGHGGNDVLVHHGTETPIVGCAARTLNNVGQVACQIPMAPCAGPDGYVATTPGIFSNGVLTALLPGVHGFITGINDDGEVFGTVIDCPTDTTPAVYEYFIGKPGAIQRTALSSPGLAGPLNKHGFGVLQWGSGYVVDADGRIALQGGDSPSVATPYDMNDNNDVVGSSSGIDGGIRVWSGTSMPAISDGTSAPWTSRTFASSACGVTKITNDGRVFGQAESDQPLACLYDANGNFSVPFDMISTTAEPDWTINAPSAVSHNGTIVSLASNKSNAIAFAIMKP